MQVTIDTNSGFCFGVTGAIRQAEEELQRGPLFCLGDIVHNGEEVARLEALGLETIDYDRLRELRGGRVLLRAHGEPPLTYLIARQNGIEIIDATCPVVKKLQERIRTTYQTHPDAQIVIFGKVGHAEVIGLQGQTDNTAIVVEGEQDVDKIDYSRDIYLFSQTTMSVDEFTKIVDSLKWQVERSGSDSKLKVEDTICRNVANRVERLKEFARQQDIVLFVGGKKSSNAKVLFEHCREANPNTFFISSSDELSTLPPTLYSLHSKIGICGATSTPLWLMEEIKNKLENNVNNVASRPT